VFLSLLRQTKQRYPFILAAYVLMPNHFHLLVEVKRDPTSAVMQSLLTAYARYFNRAHSRRGHLFQGRYKAILCEKETYLMELIRYIHLNPVRAGLAETPDQWMWSAHAEYSGKKNGLVDAEIISGVFGSGQNGFRRYTNFLADGMGQGYVDDFHPGERNPFLGGERFQDSLIQQTIPKAGRGDRKKLDEILRAVSSKTGVLSEVIRQKCKAWPVARARVEFIRKAVLENAYHRAEVARYLGCAESYVSKVVSPTLHVSGVSDV
ncbi:MAG: transposase, partial [Endomicrobiales bacterium]